MLSEYKLLLLSLVLVLVTHTATLLIHGVSKLRVILLGSDSVDETL